jgi:hypothetical protein
MSDAVAFRTGTQRVRIDSAPKFAINGQSYGPFSKTDAELETAAAVYLTLKRSAILL